MLNLPATINVYLADRPTDLRKSFDGLAAIVESQFGMEMTSGNLFVFLNKRGTQVRLLFWERNGLCILAKRLDSGVFRRVQRNAAEMPYVEIDSAELATLLKGVEGTIARRDRRHVRNPTQDTEV